MSTKISFERLVEVLDGDRELVLRLTEAGVVRQGADGYSQREVERVLVCRTLVRELEVNVAGVDIILRLRQEIIDTRRQVAVLLEQLRQQRREGGGHGA